MCRKNWINRSPGKLWIVLGSASRSSSLFVREHRQGRAEHDHLSVAQRRYALPHAHFHAPNPRDLHVHIPYRCCCCSCTLFWSCTTHGSPLNHPYPSHPLLWSSTSITLGHDSALRSFSPPPIDVVLSPLSSMSNSFFPSVPGLFPTDDRCWEVPGPRKRGLDGIPLQRFHVQDIPQSRTQTKKEVKQRQSTQEMNENRILCMLKLTLPAPADDVSRFALPRRVPVFLT